MLVTSVLNQHPTARWSADAEIETSLCVDAQAKVEGVADAPSYESGEE